MLRQRLDKWLWCARLARTRTFAAKLIADGKVRINGERASKIATPLKVGDVVTGMAAGRLFVVRVLAEAERRGSATIAKGLYENLTPAAELRSPELAAIVVRRGKRPTKRERRRLDTLLSHDAQNER